MAKIQYKSRLDEAINNFVTQENVQEDEIKEKKDEIKEKEERKIKEKTIDKKAEEKKENSENKKENKEEKEIKEEEKQEEKYIHKRKKNITFSKNEEKYEIKRDKNGYVDPDMYGILSVRMPKAWKEYVKLRSWELHLSQPEFLIKLLEEEKKKNKALF